MWASSYRLGLAAGDREFLIIDDRFEAGGANSIRGFKQNSLGPTITIEGQEFLVGGQAVVVLNQELRFPIYKLLHGGVFFDAGNVFPTVESVALDDFRESAGFGLRLVATLRPLAARLGEGARCSGGRVEVSPTFQFRLRVLSSTSSRHSRS